MLQRLPITAILVGGLVGGALDLLFAVSFAGYNGASPSLVLLTVASGLLGDAAFAGGTGVAVLGICCHFALSVLWAAVLAVAARTLPGLLHRPFIAGLVFGLVVFLCMRLVVLPLSAYPHPISFKPLATGLDLLSHMLLFGVPIALIVSRAIGRRAPNGSSGPTPLRGSA